MTHEPVQLFQKPLNIALMGQEACFPMQNDRRDVAVSRTYDRDSSSCHFDQSDRGTSFSVPIGGSQARRNEDMVFVAFFKENPMRLITHQPGSGEQIVLFQFSKNAGFLGLTPGVGVCVPYDGYLDIRD